MDGEEMVQQSLVETDSIMDARYVCFADNHTAITKGKMYEVEYGSAIGLDLSVPSKMGFDDYGYSNECYIIDDYGRKSHGLWAFVSSSFYC